MEYFQKNEHQNNNSEVNEFLRFQFADIRSRVREVGFGWNIYNTLDQRYRESQQRLSENLFDKSISESECSYTTANSLTDDDSYVTALEDSAFFRRLIEDFKSETSADSSIDKDRYKKNALITNLLQSGENNSHQDDQSTLHLLHDDQNQRKEVNANLEGKWNGNVIEEDTYVDRVIRLFQSKEDEDVYVHPLREQIQDDPVWKACRLSRKGIEITETARDYYLSIRDEEFGFFEKKKEGKKISKPRKKVTKSNQMPCPKATEL